jgi:thioredoxin 1
MKHLLLSTIMLIALTACQSKTPPPAETNTPPATETQTQADPNGSESSTASTAADSKQDTAVLSQQQKATVPLVTFVELGSVSCIPCKQMQPVMKEIEAKYEGVVKVEFHDVWKDKAAGEKYGIKLIPTQVFLDANGKEFFRHEGFFSTVEISKLLDDHLKSSQKKG